MPHPNLYQYVYNVHLSLLEHEQIFLHVPLVIL